MGGFLKEIINWGVIDLNGQNFKAGDQVIHKAHGPGVIIKLDEKCISGNTQLYYEVQMRDLKLWVPVDPSGECSLRFLTPKSKFENLFQILTGPGKPLSSERNERRLQLAKRLNDHTLESICEVIRDLTQHKGLIKMNDNDNATLERSQNILIHEWSMAFSNIFLLP